MPAWVLSKCEYEHGITCETRCRQQQQVINKSPEFWNRLHKRDRSAELKDVFIVHQNVLMHNAIESSERASNALQVAERLNTRLQIRVGELMSQVAELQARNHGLMEITSHHTREILYLNALANHMIPFFTQDVQNDIRRDWNEALDDIYGDDDENMFEGVELEEV